jgi:MFS family permease
MNGDEHKPLWRTSDIFWLFAIALVMATSGVWGWLSPRPEIGQVAVLWVPSAVLLVAILRNLGRYVFCGLAIAVFYAMGLYPSLTDNSQLSALALLSADIFEIMFIVVTITRLSGAHFRLNSPLSVGIFGATVCVACVLSGFVAALISQLPLGPMPIKPQAPLQVGVAWFTSNVATYFLIGAPLIAVTGRDASVTLAAAKKMPVPYLIGALLVMGLTFIGYFLPQVLAARTGLALGSSGLIFVAFPLAAYLAIRRGSTIAALTGAAIGIPSIYATIAGIGPFGNGNVSANVFDMQATLIVTMFTLLLVGAMGEQLRERSKALERALDDAIKRRGQGD